MKEEESTLYLDKKNAAMNELVGKYKFYAEIVKRNRLDVGHNKYCSKTDHTLCGTNWGHADIVKEITARLLWWFTGNKPNDVNIARKPTLQSITEQITKQRVENELGDDEYAWLMQMKDKCKRLINAIEIEKTRRR